MSYEAVALADAEALGLLAEPTRRRLYELVARCGRPVSRQEAAAASGVDPGLVAYHLDKLVRHGLLETTRAPARAGGPGAGRPPKLYRRPDREFAARVPARDYRLLAEVLLDAVGSGPSAQARLEQSAQATGRTIAAAARERGEELEDVLRLRGYEPAAVDDGSLRLRNCPFDRLAGQRPELVCGLNRAFLAGVLDGLEATESRAVLDPQPGLCCVAIRATGKDG